MIALGLQKPQPKPPVAHDFVADHVDPGYRPSCRTCGKPQAGHPYIATPRKPK